jgi:hypothetical protein
MSIIDLSVLSLNICKSKYMFFIVFVFFESNIWIAFLTVVKMKGVLELSFFTTAVLKIMDILTCLGHQNRFEVDSSITDFPLLTLPSNRRLSYSIVFVFCN